MATCDHCGGHVTDAFHRAYSIDGELLACRNCVTASHIDDAIRDRHPDLREPSQAGTSSPTHRSSLATEGP